MVQTVLPAQHHHFTLV